MHVLVVGSGAREHALVRALVRDPAATRVSCAPGNAGVAREPGASAVPLRADDVAGLVSFARSERVRLAVIGPEAPLVAGLADALRAEGVSVVGPGAEGARLEGSKAHAKEFMVRHGVPTARSAVFDDAAEAVAYARREGRALVVKADGLAAGKGVVVARDVEETVRAIEQSMTARAFGAAGARVVLEEKLEGDELSVHVLTDGRDWVSLGTAQDHKRLGDGDTGPNTGGMGAYAPVPRMSDPALARSVESIVQASVDGLARDRVSFAGVLFLGLMVHEGEPRVLEYNVRFGDPECAVLLARCREGGVLAALEATARGSLRSVRAPVTEGAALGVVLAAKGYPDGPERGAVIEGLDDAAGVEGAALFHAATELVDGTVRVAGGRVLLAVGHGAALEQAHARAYECASRVRFEGAQRRSDIGGRAGLRAFEGR